VCEPGANELLAWTEAEAAAAAHDAAVRLHALEWELRCTALDLEAQIEELRSRRRLIAARLGEAWPPPADSGPAGKPKRGKRKGGGR
jgi:hypothetical protein